MFVPFLLIVLYNYIDFYYFHLSSNVFIKFTVSFHILQQLKTCFWHLHPPLCSFINDQHLGSFAVFLSFVSKSQVFAIPTVPKIQFITTSVIQHRNKRTTYQRRPHKESIMSLVFTAFGLLLLIKVW